MNFLAGLLDFVNPPDHSPAAVRNHRVRIALVACAAFVGLYGLVIPSTRTEMPFFGKVAMADEVDDKIEAAQKPLKADIADLKAASAVQGQRQRMLLVASMTSQMRDLNRQRCSTKDESVRVRAEMDIETAQQTYIELTGDRYPLPSCRDL